VLIYKYTTSHYDPILPSLLLLCMPALEALGTADVLTHLARSEPGDLQALRRVSTSLLSAAHQAALAVLAETKAAFERLLQDLPKVRVAELREMNSTCESLRPIGNCTSIKQPSSRPEQSCSTSFASASHLRHAIWYMPGR
jgi:tRNA U55 pseudouridine synthase TruB